MTPRQSKERCGMPGGKGVATTSFAASTRKVVPNDGCRSTEDMSYPTQASHHGILADITERKALEQETKELSERLVNLQEEERQRIAQELHDSTAQHLVAANLNLMNLRAKVSLGSDEMKCWNEVEASMAEAMKELR